MTIAFYYALDVVSQSVFGATFDTMRNPTNRWMAKSLERGNRFMYLQLAWPKLFEWLAPFVDVNRLAYPEFSEESKLFLELCHSHIQKGREKASPSIYDLMEAEKPANVSQAELYVDAFSFMRGGKFCNDERSETPY